MTTGPESPSSFYGRRKGKQLRAGQEERLDRLLPGLRVEPARGDGEIDPAALFGASRKDVWLEIGFGGGEHLAHQARAHPEVGFLGIEPFVNGVTKLLGVIDDERLDNIRISDEDASRLLPRVKPGSLARVYLLYPDPWPKRRQRKRRFVSEPNLALLARAMRQGAELRFATDIDDYAGWALARAMRSSDFAWTAMRADDWRRPWPGWPGTRYETKARREGRGSAYLTFRRV